MAGEQQPPEMPAGKKACACACARPAAELLQPEQTPSVTMVCARLAEKLQLQPDELPSAIMVCGRLAMAKEMSFAAEKRVRGLLKELSTVAHPLEPSASAAAALSAPEHRAGLLRTLQEAQDEIRARALEVELACLEVKKMEANMLMEQKNLVLREAEKIGARIQQALASMASLIRDVLNQPAFSGQNNPSLGEAGEMMAQLEQALAGVNDLVQWSSSSRDSASTSRAHFDGAGDAAE